MTLREGDGGVVGAARVGRGREGAGQPEAALQLVWGLELEQLGEPSLGK